MMRLAARQSWPEVANFAPSASFAARVTCTSSNTMNGACPPSSSETFFTVAALCSSRLRPTSVDPVKDSARTALLSVSTPAMMRGSPVITEKIPAGTPARSASTASASAEKGVSSAGLTTMGQPASERCARLARDHGRRKIPGRDGSGDADGLADGQQPALRLVARDRIAISAASFFGEPFQKARGVVDLAARLGERLALLEGHDERKILARGAHQLAPSAQDRAARVRRACAPFRPGALRSFDRRTRLGRACRGHGAEPFASRRIAHRLQTSVASRKPAAVDVRSGCASDPDRRAASGFPASGVLESELPRGFPVGAGMPVCGEPSQRVCGSAGCGPSDFLQSARPTECSLLR